MIIKDMKTNRLLNMASREDFFLPIDGIICIGLEVQSCYFCSLSVPAWRMSSEREVERVDSLSLYVLSFKPEMAAWPIGAQLLSSGEIPTQAACSLPLETSHPRSPGTLLHTGVPLGWDA